MLKLERVSIDIQLGKDLVVDLVLLQWRTKPPRDPLDGAWNAIDPDETRQKLQILDALAAYLADRPNHPTFVVAPEFSIPPTVRQRIDGILENVSNVVFIGGLSPLTIVDYQSLEQGGFKTQPFAYHGDYINAAAIWIKPNGRKPLRRFLQAKRYRSRDEDRDFAAGESMWLFHGSNKRESLTFATTICSDFTSTGAVAELIDALSGPKHRTEVDLMFVLQMSPPRDAKQFATAATLYFSRSVSFRPVTDRSALVMLNNASAPDVHDKHGSEVAFRYQEVTVGPDYGAPTYRIRHHDSHACAFLRDTRAAAYLLQWIPLRFRDHWRDNYHARVFEAAQHVSLVPPPAKLSFANFPRVRAWVDNLWVQATAREKLDAEATFAHHSPALVWITNEWLSYWASAVQWWSKHFKVSDTVAMRVIRTFDKTSARSEEPEDWPVALQIGIVDFIRSYVLLILLGNQEASLADDKQFHLSASGRVVLFAHALGRTGEDVLREYQSDFSFSNSAAAVRRAVILVVVGAIGSQSWHAHAEGRRGRYDRSRKPNYGVTSTVRGSTDSAEPRFVWTTTRPLLEHLHRSYTEGKKRIARDVKELFECRRCMK